VPDAAGLVVRCGGLPVLSGLDGAGKITAIGLSSSLERDGGPPTLKCALPSMSPGAYPRCEGLTAVVAVAAVILPLMARRPCRSG